MPDELEQARTEGHAPSDSPPEETEQFDGVEVEDEARDDGDTVVASDDGEEPQHDDEDDEEDKARGNVPYVRFERVTAANRARDEALAKAGLRFDVETGTVVPIASEDADDWDAEPEGEPPEEAEEAPEKAQPFDPVRFARAVIAATPAQIVEWAEENGYGEWTEAQAVDFKVAQRDALRDHEEQARETQAREARARTGIGKALAEAGEDPYLSVCPEALNDLKETIKVARTRGVPYAQIEQDMEFLVGAAIKKHLPTLLERHGAKKVASASERRKTLVSQSPAQPVGTTRTVSLTAAQARAAKGMGMSHAEYAKFMED